MKNLSKLQLFLLQNLIASLPLIFMIIWWKANVLNHLNNIIIYLAYLALFFFINLYVFIQKVKDKKHIFLESIYTCILGTLFCFNSMYSNFNLFLSIAVCVSLYFMYEGNKQALIPQDAPNAGLMQAYDAAAYKKSQRMWGRLRFGFGFVALITFLIISKEYYFHAFITLFVAYYISIFIWLYKSSKEAI